MSVEPHCYLSTACLHGIHTRCARTCKFCDAPCACGCTHTEQDEQPLRDALERLLWDSNVLIHDPTTLADDVLAFLRAIPPSSQGEHACA